MAVSEASITERGLRHDTDAAIVLKECSSMLLALVDANLLIYIDFNSLSTHLCGPDLAHNAYQYGSRTQGS